MSTRMWILAVAGWVGVVVAGSALTWIAINRAGGQVTAGPGVATTQPSAVGTVDPTPTPAHQPSTRPSRRPPVTPTTRPSPSTAPTHSATTPSAPAPRPSSTPARRESRTWTGSAGFVTVSCTGRQAQLTGASPSSGWSYEVGDSSGDSVEVTFKRSEDEVDVHATCIGGTPQFEVESGGD